MSLFDILRADGSIVVNKRLARAIGVQSAIMYSELLSKHYYFEREGMLKDGWFYNTIEDMEKDTTLKESVQRKCIKILVDEGLIENDVKGMPATRYFRIIFDELQLLTVLKKGQFFENERTSSLKNTEQVLSKSSLNNTNNNTKQINNTSKEVCPKDTSKQKTLIDIKPSSVESTPKKKKRLSHAEVADEHISLAQQTGDWSKVTDRDFTYYYIKKHNEVLAEISFDRYSSVSIIRDSFIKRHNIPKDKVCEMIDSVIANYQSLPNKRDSLTFNMIDKYISLMNDLVRTSSTTILPVEREFTTNKFTQDKNSNKTNYEVF